MRPMPYSIPTKRPTSPRACPLTGAVFLSVALAIVGCGGSVSYSQEGSVAV